MFEKIASSYFLSINNLLTKGVMARRIYTKKYHIQQHLYHYGIFSCI